MQTMRASEFKARALEIMNRVAESKEPVLVTKRGKPMVQVKPAEAGGARTISGRLAGTLEIRGDIVSSLGEDLW